jgi:precorrin-3B synthase
VLRPWRAGDGLLVRLRLIGGRVPADSLRALAGVAEEYGDGRVYVTVRANLQVRALPGRDGALAPSVLAAIESTGLLPAPRHELVRNVLVSPQTGLAGGLADLRPAAAELDMLLRADERLAGLPGRFLFVLDDGRGDLIDRGCDLGLAALGGGVAQLRAGAEWGPVVPIASAAGRLAELAGAFLRCRGSGPAAPWHVAELPDRLIPVSAPDPRLPQASGPLPYGTVPGGRHVPVTDAGLDPAGIARLTAGVPEVIVTPWRGVLVPAVPEENSRWPRGLR